MPRRRCGRTAAHLGRSISPPGARIGCTCSARYSPRRSCSRCPLWRMLRVRSSPPTGRRSRSGRSRPSRKRWFRPSSVSASRRAGGASSPSLSPRPSRPWCSRSRRPTPGARGRPASSRPASSRCGSEPRPPSPCRASSRRWGANRRRSTRSSESGPTRWACCWRSRSSCRPERTCGGCAGPGRSGRSTATPRMRRAWWRSSARLRNSRRSAFSPLRRALHWATGPMKALPWLSDTLRRLNPRERRVVLGGALVSATALVIVLLGLPLAHHWAVREAAYTVNREQWLRLAALAASTDRLRRAVDERKLAHATDEARLVTGATPALAASALQGLLQRYADESSVQLNRVDVASQPRPDQPGLLAIPVQLQCQGDVYGLVDFLSRLAGGEKLLSLDELSLNAGFTMGPAPGSGPRRDRAPQPLSWSLRLHGLYRAGGAPSS